MSIAASLSARGSTAEVPTTLQSNEVEEEFGPQMINKLEVNKFNLFTLQNNK